ncbi:MAG: hypothetical protein M3280_09970 [Actinomycetota bacterium]|nr:hypothetical protein [Actinomycetota bacterium]
MSNLEARLREALLRRAEEVSHVERLPRRVEIRAKTRAAITGSLAILAGVALVMTAFVGVRALQSPNPDRLGPAGAGGPIVFTITRVPSEVHEKHVEAIYTVNEDGTELHRLTRRGEAGSPTWSPSGDEIAFQRVVTEARRVDQGIYVMRSTGTGLKELFSLPRRELSIWEVEWSPTGDKIGFILTKVPSGKSTESEWVHRLYVMNSDGADMSAITDGGEQIVDFSWSPDGKKILYTRQTLAAKSRFAYDLYTMDSDGTNATPLTQDGRSMDGAWSPDGNRVAFASYTAGRFSERDIYVMNVDGSSRRLVLADPYVEEEPAWAPDGSELVFSDFDGRNRCGLMVVRPDGTESRSLVDSTGNEGCPGSPAWSPAP